MIVAWTLRRIQNPIHSLAVFDYWTAAIGSPEIHPSRTEWSNRRLLLHPIEDGLLHVEHAGAASLKTARNRSTAPRVAPESNVRSPVGCRLRPSARREDQYADDRQCGKFHLVSPFEKELAETHAYNSLAIKLYQGFIKTKKAPIARGGMVSGWSGRLSAARALPGVVGRHSGVRLGD